MEDRRETRIKEAGVPLSSELEAIVFIPGFVIGGCKLTTCEEEENRAISQETWQLKSSSLHYS